MGFDIGNFMEDYLNPVAIVSGPIGIAGAAGLFGKDAQNFFSIGKSGQRDAQEKAQEAANKAREEAAKLQRERNRQQYIQQIRAARIQRARTANVTTMEPGISSGSLGALSSIGSQLSNNINFMQTTTDSLNRIQRYENVINKQTARADKYASYNKQAWGAIKLATQAAGMIYGGPAAVDVVGGTQTGTTSSGLPVYDVTGTATAGRNVFMNTGLYNG